MYLILASDTVPGVIRVRFPQAVAPDLGERVVGEGVTDPTTPRIYPLHDRTNVSRSVVHTSPRLKGRTR
jgi:hypothetical protein